MNQIALGQTLRCKITGFVGVATSRVTYLGGVIQYCLKPPVGEDGKMPEGEYVNAQQLFTVGKEPPLEVKMAKLIPLGKPLRCKITGFEGIATAVVEYLNGCVQYCLKPRVGKDGKMPDGEFIDAQQLQVLGTAHTAEPETLESPGGVMADPPSTTYTS